MKKFLSYARPYLGRTGFYFLLTILIFAFVALATVSATVNLVLIWSALLFSAMLALFDGILTLKALRSYGIKISVHTVLTIIAFAVSFVWVSGVIESGKSALWSIFLFALFMLLINGIRTLVYILVSKKQNETKAYDYLYTPKA